jgi:hypothetical protein
MAATNSNTQQKSDTSSQNNQVGAGTGGAAVGANSSGNSISLTTVSTDNQATSTALSSNTVVATDAISAGVTESSNAALANLAVSQAALTANNHATDSAIGGIVAVTGQAGALLQSTFTQFTGALDDANNKALIAQDNASNAGLNIIANAAPQTNSSLQEHLAGVAVIPAPQSVGGSNSITISEIAVAGLSLAALYLIFSKSN